MVPSHLHADLPVDFCPSSDPNLVRLVAVWPRLPDAIKAGILAMVEVAGGSDA